MYWLYFSLVCLVLCSIQWTSFFLFVVGAVAVITLALPAMWGFIPGTVGAIWALFAFIRRQYTLGILVTLLSVLLFISLSGVLRSIPTHFAIVPTDAQVSVGDTVPITDVHPIQRD